MKMPKILTSFLFLLIFSVSALAGGSSVGIYETNLQDKMLTAGQSDQLLMSFTIEPWEGVPGDLLLKSLDFHCSPGQGFSQLTLHSDQELAATEFTIDENGRMMAGFDEIDFTVPNGIATEFSLLVDVESGTGDFVTACTLDWLQLFNADIEEGYELNRITGDFNLDTLVYVDDPAVNSDNEKMMLTEQIVNETVLGPNSTNNNILSFQLSESKTAMDPDIFVHCTNARSLKNLTLHADGNIFSADLQLDVFNTGWNAEEANEKRFVFSNLNLISESANEAGMFEFYGDARDYYVGSLEKGPHCEILNVETEKLSVINETISPDTPDTPDTSQTGTDQLGNGFFQALEGDTINVTPEDAMKVFEPTFTDINEKHPHFTAIEYLANRGIFKGHPDGTFRDEEINRAELMELMIRLLNIQPDPQVYKECFPDVEGWYEAAVCYAKEQDWIQGYPDGKFRPDQFVNNAERFKIILNPLFKEEIEAQEIDVEDLYHDKWYIPYFNFVQTKVLGGSSLYSIDDPSFRSKVAEMIFRALLVKESNLDFYHPYLKDKILKEQNLAHLIINVPNCYSFDDLEFDFYSDYLASEYGIADFKNHDVDDIYEEFFEQQKYPLIIDLGSFCPLPEGGFLFNSLLLIDALNVERHLIRTDEEGSVISDDKAPCSLLEFGEFYSSNIPLEADIETFELLSCLYSRDSSHIYFDAEILEEADVSSFEVLTLPYAKDKNHVYMLDETFGEADANTFEPLLNRNLPFNIAFYSKDAENVYSLYGDVIEYADPKTFETVPLPVPVEPKNIEEFVDLFDKIENMIFGKDDRHVFASEELITGLDSDGFEILSPFLLKDKNYIYHFGYLLAPLETHELDIETAEFFGEGEEDFYLQDANGYICTPYPESPSADLYCGQMSSEEGMDWVRYQNQDQYIAFDWPREWGPVMDYDQSSLFFYAKEKGVLRSIGEDENKNNIFIVLRDSTLDIGGNFWGNVGYSLDSQEAVESYCNDKENCQIIENRNGIRMAKHDFVISEGGNTESTSQYYLFNPKSQKSGIVISPIRIKNRGEIENFDELFEAFVDSIEFVD